MKKQVQFVINLADGWWCAVGRDEAAEGPSTGKFSPVNMRAAAKRGAAKRKSAVPKRKPGRPRKVQPNAELEAAYKVMAKEKRNKGRPKLSLVRTFHKDATTVVACEVGSHYRKLKSGKRVRVRGYSKGPHARHYKAA
jgi:hypothetical protein